MTTFTLNRNLDATDCLFVALNDTCYADWKASQRLDEADIRRYTDDNSFIARIRKFFTGR